jgi:hypothetical protein
VTYLEWFTALARRLPGTGFPRPPAQDFQVYCVRCRFSRRYRWQETALVVGRLHQEYFNRHGRCPSHDVEHQVMAALERQEVGR